MPISALRHSIKRIVFSSKDLCYSWPETPVSERIVNRSAVREEDDAEPASFHCLDACRAANAAVGLNGLVFRVSAGVLDPFGPNHGTIRGVGARARSSGWSSFILELPSSATAGARLSG